ncbi:LytR C-terminal domain-containing protein [candidate division WWE3 bacterium]|nr:LytR C-terminal domain-containing protein [candidate division WWE3 bacterium]
MKFNGRTLVITILSIALLASLGAAGFFYMRYQESIKNNAQAEVQDLKVKLATHMVLPAEEPTLATVTDKSKLEGQPFFQGAENGDKVFIFTQARRAVLYRPASDRIIDVVPVNISQPVNPANQDGIQQDPKSNEQGSTQGAKTEKKTTVSILNTTDRQGVAAEINQLIANGNVGEVNPVINESYKGNRYYDQTIVVSMNENSRSVAEKIAKVLGAQIAKLPAEESNPNSDIAVYVGFDRK